MTSVHDSQTLPTQATVTGRVDFAKFFDCRKTKEILPRHYCEAGSNWLNQMKIIGVAMGDYNADMKFSGDDFAIEVNGEDERQSAEVLALLNELKDSGIVTQYSLVLVADDQMVTMIS